MPTLKIGLGQWFGEYRGITRQWLRWYDVEGTGFPRMQSSGAGASAADLAQQQRDLAQQQIWLNSKQARAERS